MKKLQILGSGCARCAKLAETTGQAAQALGIPCHMEKVTDIQEIMSFGVTSTPALVVDGVVKTCGNVPTLEQLKELLS